MPRLQLSGGPKRQWMTGGTPRSSAATTIGYTSSAWWKTLFEYRSGNDAGVVKHGAATVPTDKDMITTWTIMPDPSLPPDTAIVYREFNMRMIMTFKIHQEFTIKGINTPAPKIVKCAGKRI